MIGGYLGTVGRRSIPISIFIIVLALFSALFHDTIVLAAVTLVYFRASAQTGVVLLEWETATELDNAGFFINRSLSQNSGYSRIGDFIPARGDPLLGATYQYSDRNVSNGVLYWYKLETIDIQQNSDLYEPPVSVILGGTWTPTATATATRTQGAGNPTSTRTPTRTSRPGSPTRTPTLGGYNPYPAPSIPPGQTEIPVNNSLAIETQLPTFDSDVPITPTLERTATLIPFPTITLEFPYPAAVSVPTPPSFSNSLPGISWFTPMRLLFILFVAFVWIFLGGWYYFSLRRME
jgi:hypothetical protein